MEPFLPGASVNVEILTFTFLQLQSRPPVVKWPTSFRPFALHLVIFYSLYEMRRASVPESSLAAALENNEIGFKYKLRQPPDR